LTAEMRKIDSFAGIIWTERFKDRPVPE